MCQAFPLPAETLIDGTWSDGPVTLTLDFSGVPVGSDDPALLQQAVVSAAARWNTVIGRPFFQIADSHAGSSPGSGNGLNEIYFSSSPGTFYAAVDIQRDRNFRRIESDIVLSETHPWFNYRGPLRHDENGIRIPDLYRVALHEMGHIIGFTHAEPETSRSAMRAHMSDVDDLTREDIRDAGSIVAKLFEKNAPRFTSPHRFRVVTSARVLRLRGTGTPFFIHAILLEIDSSAGSRLRHVRVSRSWSRKVALNEGVNRLRFYYRMPDRSLVRFATKVILAR
jgi:hypothetical protein